MRYRCKFCGKKLTALDSKLRGYGPECAKKYYKDLKKRKLI